MQPNVMVTLVSKLSSDGYEQCQLTVRLFHPLLANTLLCVEERPNLSYYTFIVQ